MELVADAVGRRAGGGGMVLAGAPGVGKTRLAREALRMAARRGARTHWAAATRSARSLPLGAFAPMLGEVGADPARLVRSAIEALIPGARGGVVVGVDDAHLLDDVSAMLVHRLALRAGVTLIVTVRSGEPAPDAVTALWKDGLLSRVELQPLSEPELATLVEAVLGGSVDSHSLRRLWEITRGNALYLRHLVDAQLECGRLCQVRGVWQWRGHPVLSPGLTELVDSRVGRLSAEVGEVVDLLAFGEPLGAGMLAALAGAAAVEEAEQRGLISVERDGRRLPARLAHPLYGEVRRARTSVLRARRLRGRIAEAIIAAGARRGDDLLRRAVLSLDSDVALEPQLLTVAGWRASELLDLRLAERLAGASCSAGGGFEAHLLMALVLFWRGRCDEADVELDAVYHLAATDAERARATVPQVANLFWGLARPVEAESILRRALDTVTDEPSQLVLTAMGAALDAFLARVSRAADSARTLLARPDLPGLAVMFAIWGLALGTGLQGRSDAVSTATGAWTDTVVQRWGETAPPAESSMLMFVFAHVRVVVLRLAGWLGQARAVAEHFRGLAADTPGIAQHMASVLTAEAELGCGRVRTAARSAMQARSALEHETDPGGWVFNSLLVSTLSLAMAGDVLRARDALAELRPHPAHRYRDPEVLLARAWVAAAEGAVGEGATLAREAASIAATCELPTQEIGALHAAVRFGDATVAERLTVLASAAQCPIAGAAAAQATALAEDDPKGLDRASVQLEGIGMRLAAADAAAQAAVLHHRHGRTSAGTAAAVRAQALASACENAATPAMRAMLQPSPLTDREREIATLAATGLSNRDIAGRLVVSVRTVEGHIYHACTKLGVTDRSALAETLGLGRSTPSR